MDLRFLPAIIAAGKGRQFSSTIFGHSEEFCNTLLSLKLPGNTVKNHL
jgi:hypothetical protein